ncbi:MAG: FAD-dependent oxidoreductase [Acidimicrobiia bacterium]
MSHDIAIIGSGIAGLGAAWALSGDHRITVYEADSRIGGHANTVSVATGQTTTAVDTGFIVYNEVSYPNLTRLFSLLDVPTRESDMSFAFSLDRELEYAASLQGVLAQPSNLLRPAFLRMLSDINRFRKIGTRLVPRDDETLGELLRRHRFSETFMADYLYPMTGAIWSTEHAAIGDFPAAAILKFLGNHGLITIAGRPTWRTVVGGSRAYVQRLVAGFEDRIRTNSPVTSVTRTSRGVLIESNGHVDAYDQVVLATHSDQALGILGDEATQDEHDLLEAIPYTTSRAVLHSDPALMPRNRRVWSSWNAMAGFDDILLRPASVTYWMNRLQGLDIDQDFFVSLNPLAEPNPSTVRASFRYAHPRFDLEAVAAQSGIASIQGMNNTWYAGAYLGYGFHEDGLQSGLNVAAALGSPAPWHGTFTPMSSAPAPKILEMA